MEIRLLGPAVRIMVDGQAVNAGTLKERAILATLALAPGKVVPTGTIIERVWGSAAPASVRSSLHAYISRIRHRIRETGAGIGLLSRSRGYILEIPRESVDWHRMRLLRTSAAESAEAGEHRRAAELLAAALDLWEGDPLAEIPGPWTHGYRRSMHETWLLVVERWAQACLQIGRFDDVIAHVSEVAARHPDHEGLAVVLMKALAGSGRHAEALGVHARLRADLAARQGGHPCDATQEVFQRILTGQAEGADPAPGSGRPGARTQVEPGNGGDAADAAEAIGAADPAAPAAPPGAASAAPAAPAASAVPVHDSISRGIGDFSARAGELAAILARARSRPDATTVVVVSGLGGMGKTALAVRAAHLLRGEFDIRLQLDLHGHTAGQVPLDPAQALHMLLRKLDVGADRIPSEPEARAALWSSRLAGRRALLLLDDATRGSIAPLIPGTPGCVVLVTSRWTLTELDGVHHVPLAAPEPDEAAAMLTEIAGLAPDRAGDADVRRIVLSCARLPLALRVAGGRLRHHPTWTPGYLADRIARNGLAEMRSADHDVAGVFATSVQALSAGARAAFLRIALHPSPEFSLPALAAALGSPAHEAGPAEAAADELLDTHLVEEVGPGRYRMHTLLREFARSRAAEVLSAAERRAVLLRVLDHYWAAADAADRAVSPMRRRPPALPTAPEHPEPFATAAAARHWFEEEYPAIDAALTCAREGEFSASVEVSAYAVRLPLAIGALSDTDGPWESAERHLAACLELCREQGDDGKAALAAYELSRVQRRVRRLDDAKANAEAALAQWRRDGDVAGEALARDQLGLVHSTASRNTDAVEEHEAALALLVGIGDRQGKSEVLDHLGTCRASLGELDAAEVAFTEAAELSGELGDRHARARAFANFAGVLKHRGYHRDAQRICEQVIGFFEEIEDRMLVGRVTHNLGEILEYQGRPEEAEVRFQRAHELLVHAGDEAQAVRCLAGVGRAQVALGRAREAWSTMENALNLIAPHSDPVTESELMLACGDVLSALQRTAEARLHYSNARGLAGRGVSALAETLAHDRLGDLSSRLGKRAEAEQHWGRALRLAAEMRTYHADTIQAKLGCIESNAPFDRDTCGAESG